MNEIEIARHIIDTFPNVETAENYGYTFFFFGHDHHRPFASLSSADYEYDRFSNLDRPGVFRLNLGVGKETFQSLFGTGRLDVDLYDFTQLDTFMPHPEYAAHHFICVLSPGEVTFEKLRPMLAEAYNLAKRRSGENPVPP